MKVYCYLLLLFVKFDKMKIKRIISKEKSLRQKKKERWHECLNNKKGHRVKTIGHSHQNSEMTLFYSSIRKMGFTYIFKW